MVEWVNKNNGLVICVLTFVYVLATLWMARLGHKANAISRRNVETVLELERRRLRPHVVFDFVFERFALYASIRNIGQTGAYDLVVHVDPPIVPVRGTPGRMSVLLEANMSFLAPGREVRDFVDSAALFYEREKSPVFSVRLSYKDTDGNQIVESMRHDLGVFQGMAVVDTVDQGKELREIRKELERVRHSIDKLVPAK